MKSWNIALNTFLEIKNKAAATGQDLWNYNRHIETCLSYWARLTVEEMKREGAKLFAKTPADILTLLNS